MGAGNVNLDRELEKDSHIVVIYDGDCPLCSTYIRVTRLSKAVGRPTLVNARERPELVRTLAENGVNLDAGMAVYYEGRLYAGSDAVHLLALLTTPVDLANQVAAAILGRQRLARALYPALRAGRNFLLKLKRRPQLAEALNAVPVAHETLESPSGMETDVR
jgi:predicted DCC family thiol-disulfide oxidoreductase YuxK